MTQRPRDLGRPPGFSLIELLVAMTIGLVVTLAITSVMIRSEATKRTHTSVSDIDQTGAFTAFVLDRAIRSAGSGFSQDWNKVYGCRLDVTQGSTATLPITNAIGTTSAFNRVTSAALPIRMAPVIVAKGLADVVSPAQTRGDVLMVMSGNGGVSEVSQLVTPGSVKSSELLMQSGYGYKTNDLVLLADPSNVPAACLVEQVGTRSATDASASLPLAAGATAPSYYTAAGTLASLGQFNTAAIVLQLGNTASMPQFQLFGVGPNNTLNSLDLLTPVAAGTVPDVPVADGVVELRALYGLDTNKDGVVDQWVDPDPVTATYSAATLLNGSPGSRALLRQIVAIRVGMILRSSLQEQDPVIGPKDASGLGTQALKLTLFSDLKNSTGGSLAYTRTYAAGTPDLNYRYRTVENTIPLRNVLNAP